MFARFARICYVCQVHAALTVEFVDICFDLINSC